MVERSSDAAPVRLREFPRGARAGECLHAILEHVRFDAPPEEIEELTARTLAVHGIAAEWAGVVTRAIVAVLEAPLGGDAGGFRFRNLAPACRRSELEFLLASASEEAPVTPARLSGVFTEGPSNSYAPRLARLPFPPFAGFLRGFVDLVFEQEGRWYVVDWKSNFLGETVADYHPGRLRQVMEDHHYTLQFHLYALALHRHLAARLPGYDYERHFGGRLLHLPPGSIARASGGKRDLPRAPDMQANRRARRALRRAGGEVSELFTRLSQAGFLSPLDRLFAESMLRLGGGPADDSVLLATALVSRQVERGHVCLDLARPPAPVAHGSEVVEGVVWPEAGGMEGGGGKESPGDRSTGERNSAVLDEAGRLYLRRYWEHQRKLAEALLTRAFAGREPPDETWLRTALFQLFRAIATSINERPHSPL